LQFGGFYDRLQQQCELKNGAHDILIIGANEVKEPRISGVALRQWKCSQIPL